VGVKIKLMYVDNGLTCSVVLRETYSKGRAPFTDCYGFFQLKALPRLDELIKLPDGQYYKVLHVIHDYSIDDREIVIVVIPL
jgi:hypothetical protein